MGRIFSGFFALIGVVSMISYDIALERRENS